MKQFASNKYIYSVDDKVYRVYYKKYLDTFKRRNPSIDCSDDAIKKLLLENDYDESDIDKILYVLPKSKGKKSSKKNDNNNNDENNNDDDDDDDNKSHTTEITENVDYDNSVQYVNDDDDDVPYANDDQEVEIQEKQVIKQSEPKYKLIELQVKIKEDGKIKKITERYAYDSTIVTTRRELDEDLYDVYEIENYEDKDKWNVKNPGVRYGVMDGKTGEIAKTDEEIDELLRESDGTYLH